MKFVLKHFGKIIEERRLEEGAEYFVGRHKDCDFVLQEEEGLSRKHLKIYQSEETGNWIIESLSDLGGLYLEGEEVDGAEMEADSSFSLKSYTLEFKTESRAPGPQAGESTKVPAPLQGRSLQPVNPADEITEATKPDGKTKFMAEPHLLYSLYIYIQGEFSDHIRLNDKKSWTLGRAKDCDISIDYSILTRKHLKIFNKDGAFYVEDLKSANKSFLNGRELMPRKPVLLRANDKISVSDLKIIFEVRNQNLEKMMSQLTAPAEDDKEASQPAVAAPKVILEDIPEKQATPGPAQKKSAIHRKIGLILAVPFILGPVLYFQNEEKKKEKAKLALQQKEKEQRNQLELLYEEGLKSHEQEKYSFCIRQLEELHALTPSGYFKDSQQILSQCRLGQENQKKMEERKAQEEQRREIAEKIKKIVEKCKKEFAENKIRTEEELNACAAELISGLDPMNTDMAAIKMQIMERENLKSLEAEKQAAFRKQIQSKKVLYNKARRLRDQGKPLKAVKAYNVFVRAVKNFTALKKLKAQAIAERDEILSKYNSELDALHSSCESLIKTGKMKEAYYDCKKVLEFKSDDKKALDAIRLSKNSLQKRFKPLYEQSMLDESFSRIEEAKKIWREITAKDIKEGYYYQKALFQLNKYR